MARFPLYIRFKINAMTVTIKRILSLNVKPTVLLNIHLIFVGLKHVCRHARTLCLYTKFYMESLLKQIQHIHYDTIYRRDADSCRLMEFNPYNVSFSIATQIPILFINESWILQL